MRKKYIFASTTLLLIISFFIIVSISYTFTLYSKNQLFDLRIDESNISFKLPLESVYYPVLAKFERKDNLIEISVFRQLAIGPFHGIARTPIATDTTYEYFIPHKISEGNRITIPLYKFGLSSPKYILLTSDGNEELRVKSD